MALNSLVRRVCGSVVPPYLRVIGGAIRPVHGAAGQAQNPGPDPDRASKSVIGKTDPSGEQTRRIPERLRDRFPTYILGCPFQILDSLDPLEYRDEIMLCRRFEDEAIAVKVKVQNNADDTCVEKISMRVKIYHGYNSMNVLEFGVHAFAAYPDRIIISYVSMCNLWSKDPSGHLEAFQGYFEERGISPRGLSFLFNSTPKFEPEYCFSTELPC